MRRTPRPVPLVLALAALLFGGGCSSAVPGAATAGGGAPSSAAPTTEKDPVAWVDDVCGAVLPFIQTAGKPPALNPQGDPATLVRGLSDYLSTASTSADAAVEGMKAAGPSPVEGGDEIVTRLSGTFGTLSTTFKDAQTRIDALDTSDPQALATELPEAVAPLAALQNLEDPTKDLAANPELDRAAKQAPNCRKIETTTGG